MISAREKKSDGSGDPPGRPDVEAYAEMPATVGPPDLADVFRAHHDAVWRGLWSFGVPRTAIDDATQDVFVVVHRRLADYDGRAPIRRWVLGIARKVALKYRERAAKQLARMQALDGDAPAANDAPVAEDALARREASAFVGRFLDKLPVPQRSVFVLVDIDGMSAVEAADVLGINVNTVYSRLRVARQRFDEAVRRRRKRSSR